MIKKFVIISKHLILGVGVLVGVLSCEKDFKNIGVDVVDNNVFNSEKYVSEVITYNSDITRNQTNNNSDKLLGILHDTDFGKLEASIVAQLHMPKKNPDYGIDAIIDTIILDIPFEVKKESNQDDGKPKYSYESVWTSGDKSFQFNVFRLGTYLSTTEIDDPTALKKYYSDDVFIREESLFSGVVSPSLVDTMLVVKRYDYPSYPSTSDKVVYKQDTIKSAPSLKIALDENFFKTQFQDLATESEFASVSNFQHHFKGLYLEALESAADNDALMLLKLATATVKVYYSYKKDEGASEDLNGNGTTGETNVYVPGEFSYPLAGVKSNLYNRDYSGTTIQNYLDNPDDINGEEKLFLSGAIGSNAILKLFGEDTNADGIPDELALLRTKEWLINDAQLTIYVDESSDVDEKINAIFLYNIKDGENIQMFEGAYDPKTRQARLGDPLETDSDKKPIKYVIHITDFIAEIIKPDTDIELLDFGIKVFESTDVSQSETDTHIKDFSSNHKGVILKGNLPSTDEKRIKLEIYYSEKN